MTTKRLYLVVGVVLLLGLAVVPALAQTDPYPVSGNGVTPEYVAGNPVCTDYGLVQVAYFNQPAGSSLVDGPVTVTTTDVGMDGDIFSWLSSLGIDKVIVKGGNNSNVYSYDEAYSDSNLHPPINPENSKYFDISHISFCADYELTATKTANTSLTRTYSWDITKDYDYNYSKFIGDPATVHNYVVNVTRYETDSNWVVSGQITVNNPTPFTVDIGVSDSVGGTAVDVLSCPGYSIAPGGSVTCTYSAGLAGAFDGTNIATITSNTVGVNGTTAVADYYFANATVTPSGYPTVNVTDDKYGYLGQASGTMSFSVTGSFECPTNQGMYANGVYIMDPFVNTAMITETGQSDNATVNLICYAPIVSKDATATWWRDIDWTIEKSVTPSFADKFIGESATYNYTVTVTKTATDTYIVSGNINVTNPAGSPGDLTVSVADVLDGMTAANVVCPGGGTSLTVASGMTGSCSYSGTLAAKVDGTNTATATFNGIPFGATADYAFGAATYVEGSEPETITVSDTYYQGGLGPFSDSMTSFYSRVETCSSIVNDYAGSGFYSAIFDNTATINETIGDSDSETVTLNCYAPVVSKDATATYNEVHYWEVDKTVDPESQSAFAGETVPFQWKVVVTEDVENEAMAVTGNIKVKNPAPMAMTVTLTDVLDVATPVLINCSVGTLTDDQLLIPANTEALCTYTANPSDITAMKNTVTATLNGISFSYEAPLTWTWTVIDGSVWLDDDQVPTWPTEISDGDTFYYNDEYQCSTDPADYGLDPDYPSQYTYIEPNLAKVYNETETLDQDDASTSVDCYVPSISKDAAGTYNERHEWTVVKDVTPPTSGYPGDELGWTWTVMVTEVVVEENFNVSGQITVINPNPEDAMTVMLSDVLSDGKPAVITACTGDADLTDGLTIVAGGSSVCDYQALNLGYNNDLNKAESNIASFSLFKIDYAADATIAWEVNRIHPNVTLTDDQGPLSEPLTGHTAPGTYTFGPFSYSGSHICSSNKADYFVGGVYTAISETLVNWAKIKDGETLLDEDDATTTWTCEAGFIDLLKWTDGLVNAAKDWQFALYLGPDGFGGTQFGATSSTLNDGDGVLEFGGPALRPDTAYTVCELDVPAGWTSFWQVSLDGGFTWATVIPYNPNADDVPPEDLGNRCVDFGLDTTIPVSEGLTIHFWVDNTYPGGSPRTPGYWKNWNRCTGGRQQYTADANGGWEEGYWLLEDVLDPNIGGGIVWDDILTDDIVFNITSCEQAVLILDKRNVDGKKVASDPLHNLATHLLAAQLNFGAGACTTQQALDAALAAEELLDKYNFQGEYEVKLSKADGALANSLAGTLDAYNNGEFCGDGGE